MLPSSLYSRILNSCPDALPTKASGVLTPKVGAQCSAVPPATRDAETPGIAAASWTISGLFFSIYIRPRALAASNLLGFLADIFDLDSVVRGTGLEEPETPSHTLLPNWQCEGCF